MSIASANKLAATNKIVAIDAPNLSGDEKEKAVGVVDLLTVDIATHKTGLQGIAKELEASAELVAKFEAENKVCPLCQQGFHTH
jgi:hypothetical protein